MDLNKADENKLLSPKIQEPLNRQEKKGIILLLILYTIQGLPIGFFMIAISLLLTEKGAQMVELAQLSGVAYPFTFKFLLAPFQDSYFFKSFGKRKSYIVPLQYLLAIIFFFSASHVESMIENKNIFGLFSLGFASILIASQQDVAVDGWVITIFEKEEHLNLGATCNTIGQTLGALITSGIFIQLNSVEFCNQYLFSTPRDTPLVTASQLLYILAGVIFVVTFIVHFFVSERSKPKFEEHSDKETSKPQIEHKEMGVFDVLNKLKGFITNSNLRLVIVLYIINSIGLFSVSASIGTKLIKNGLKKEVVSQLQTFMTPIEFIFAVLASKVMRAGREISNIRYIFSLSIFNSIFGYFLVQLNPSINEANQLIVIILMSLYSLLSCLISNLRFVNFGGFSNRISDDDIGGSSITTLNSISNLGGQLATQVSLAALDYFSYTTVAFSGMLYSLLFLILALPKFIKLEALPKSAWAFEKLKNK